MEYKEESNRIWTDILVFIGLPIIEGYQNSKLVEEGTSLHAEIVGRHVEKEFMFTHPH